MSSVKYNVFTRYFNEYGNHLVTNNPNIEWIGRTDWDNLPDDITESRVWINEEGKITMEKFMVTFPNDPDDPLTTYTTKVYTELTTADKEILASIYRVRYTASIDDDDLIIDVLLNDLYAQMLTMYRKKWILKWREGTASREEHVIMIPKVASDIVNTEESEDIMVDDDSIGAIEDIPVISRSQLNMDINIYNMFTNQNQPDNPKFDFIYVYDGIASFTEGNNSSYVSNALDDFLVALEELRLAKKVTAKKQNNLFHGTCTKITPSNNKFKAIVKEIDNLIDKGIIPKNKKSLIIARLTDFAGIKESKSIPVKVKSKNQKVLKEKAIKMMQNIINNASQSLIDYMHSLLTTSYFPEKPLFNSKGDDEEQTLLYDKMRRIKGDPWFLFSKHSSLKSAMENAKRLVDIYGIEAVRIGKEVDLTQYLTVV